MEYVMIGTGMLITIICIWVLEEIECRRWKNEERKNI